MAVMNQVITENYAAYNGDSIEVMGTFPDMSVDFSIYSPPFCGLYNYSSSDRDLSNCKSYDEFFVHYAFVVNEISRLTKPGRFSAVHCMDTPKAGANIGGLTDFPGDIIRLHEKHGFELWARHLIWKEPLGVRNRTMAKGLAHRQICEDASLTTIASADQLLMFRKKGENAIPVEYPNGLLFYAGEREIPKELYGFRGWKGDQKQNRFSHWIWRHYASSFWDDIRIDRVLPYKESREEDDERHVHPLQLDVIERACVLRSNPDEVVLTPFMGVGSECFGALVNGRKAIGIELKESYYKQALQNLAEARIIPKTNQEELFA